MTTGVAQSTVFIPNATGLATTAPVVPGELKVYPVGKRPGITLMVIAFDAGTNLANHIAKGPITLHTLEGQVEVEAAGERVSLGAGGLMHIDARVEHALTAQEQSRVLLTLFDAVSGDPHVPGIVKKSMAPTPPAVAEADLIPVQDVSGHNSHDAGCGCGEEDEALPELDVRPIPHAIRHATVFGALQSLAPAQAMILAAHHNPLPLLRQIEDMFDGRIEVSYLEEGPDVWKLKMLNTA